MRVAPGTGQGCLSRNFALQDRAEDWKFDEVSALTGLWMGQWHIRYNAESGPYVCRQGKGCSSHQGGHRRRAERQSPGFHTYRAGRAAQPQGHRSQPLPRVQHCQWVPQVVLGSRDLTKKFHVIATALCAGDCLILCPSGEGRWTREIFFMVFPVWQQSTVDMTHAS